MWKTLLLTGLALIAFAGNSVLSRLALGEGTIDAISFASIRLLSGALFLSLLVLLKTKKPIELKRGNWASSLSLFLYAMSFSYAYLTLDTGVGALILFGCVQATLIVYGTIKGERLRALEWFGLLLAFIGVTILLKPSSSAPSLSGVILMSISGIAWGLYTIVGRGSKTPLIDTTYNFIRTAPFVVVIMALFFNQIELSNKGIILALLSGAIMSGVGYAIWYSALAKLTTIQAGVVQLLVPLIAACGGIVFSNEQLSATFIIASFLVLGGVLLVLVGKLSPK
ncbi:hypothetical protein BCU68_12990 [Vibrio sp. 10N.286.49.B3]|uniref:DMT family transporter n=1 Tax=Vibrio sp. 10N.286.49.B3 TaxID=1880855 RepID=UPI000C86421F|nr:DMT family transporter [Vibrio sp. 10N.286.49.B3]PMH43761.1 hypothetical protein BCU68_12990 [Vibrio sp. 10N.286.49.B3]